MLTPAMIQAMNAATGNNVPLDPTAPPSRAQQVLDIAKKAQTSKSAPAEEVGSAGQALRNHPVTLGDVGTDLGGAGAALAGSEVGAGQDIAGAITAPQQVQHNAAMTESDTKYLSTLFDLKKKAEAEGQDTSHWDALIKGYKPVNQTNDIAPALDKTNGQVLGDFGGVALDAATAGTYGAGMKTGELAVKAAPTIVSAAAKGAEAATDAVVQTGKNIVKKVGGDSAAKTESFVRDLVMPEQTTGKTGTLTSNIKAGRVDEGGLMSGRTVNPDTHQVAIENEVKTVPGIKKGQTALESANAIHDEIGATATKLQDDLADREVQPLVTEEYWNNYLDGVKSDIEENPLLVGDAEKTASKILNKFQSLLPKGDITANHILSARKNLDAWMKTIKGSSAFDPKTENAVSIALRAVRQGANDLMEKTAPQVGVKAMLRRQSLLYDALENIAPKAAKEGGSVVERVANTIKNHKVISTGAGIVGLDVLLHKIGL